MVPTRLRELSKPSRPVEKSQHATSHNSNVCRRRQDEFLTVAEVLYRRGDPGCLDSGFVQAFLDCLWISGPFLEDLGDMLDCVSYSCCTFGGGRLNRFEGMLLDGMCSGRVFLYIIVHKFL